MASFLGRQRCDPPGRRPSRPGRNDLCVPDPRRPRSRARGFRCALRSLHPADQCCYRSLPAAGTGGRSPSRRRASARHVGRHSPSAGSGAGPGGRWSCGRHRAARATRRPCGSSARSISSSPPCVWVSSATPAGSRPAESCPVGGHLTRYGWQLGLDGSLRLGAAGVLVLLGASSLELVRLAAGPVALVGAARRLHPLAADQRTALLRRTPSLTRPFYLLVVSALAAQLLINAGPLVVNLARRTVGTGAGGVFLAVLVVVRVPVFLFAAVQPSFLPALAGYAAADRRSAFVRLLAVGVASAWLASGWLRSWSPRPSVQRSSSGSSTSTNGSAVVPSFC